MFQVVLFFIGILLISSNSAQDSGHNLLKCSLHGVRPERAVSICIALLKSSINYQNDTFILHTIGSSSTNIHFVTHDTATVNSSDAAIIFLHPTMSADQNSFMVAVQQAFKTLITTGTRRPLIVLTLGSSKYNEKAIGTLIQAAWDSYFEKDVFQSDDCTKEFDVQIVSLGSMSAADADPEASIALLSTFSQLISQTNQTVDAIYRQHVAVTSKLGDATSENRFTETVGAEIWDECITNAVEWARSAANDVFVKMQKPEFAKEFPNFIENLVSGAKMEFSRLVNLNGGLSEPLSKLGEESVTRRVFVMMAPFFFNQVELARVDQAKAFNAAVTEYELELTVRVMEDLGEMMEKTISGLRKAISVLTPRGAPCKTSWNAEYNVAQFREDMMAFLRQKEATERINGVLPRSRKPVSISMHYFVPHPLGLRDYRQDVVTGAAAGDALVYEPELGSPLKQLVHPALARKILVERSKDSSLSGGERRAAARKAEFAREMLMFPLSIKNPDVPMSGSRSRRKSSGPAEKDPLRESLGPERFIRWDMAPLNEVKRNIDELLVMSSLHRDEEPAAGPWGFMAKVRKPVVRAIDKVINIAPYFGSGYYEHPPLNYGPRLGPSTMRPQPKSSGPS